ncbi:MAG: hypothetical protein WC966_03640 [Bradymonadales bacterium]
MKKWFSYCALISALFMFSACDNDDAKDDDKIQGCEQDNADGSINYSLTTRDEIVDYLICKKTVDPFFKTEKAKNSPQTIGSPCFCYGEDCSTAGYQRPEQAKIFGCDNVPEEHQGAKRVCLRSTNAFGIEPVIYFTNGMCSNMLAKCVPVTEHAQNSICHLGAIGDAERYDEFVSCPKDSELLVEMDLNVKVLEEEATLVTKVCFPSCETDSDCRNTETDHVFKHGQTQRVCHQEPTSKKKFCVDPRNAGGKFKVITD